MMVDAGDPAQPLDPARPDGDTEEDYDLLTFAEAGERLATEIAGERARLAALLAADPEDTAAIEARRRRLADLEAAAGRNTRQPLTDATFERFFGYPAG